jgi:hypothetical protein
VRVTAWFNVGCSGTFVECEGAELVAELIAIAAEEAGVEETSLDAEKISSTKAISGAPNVDLNGSSVDSELIMASKGLVETGLEASTFGNGGGIDGFAVEPTLTLGLLSGREGGIDGAVLEETTDVLNELEIGGDGGV